MLRAAAHARHLFALRSRISRFSTDASHVSAATSGPSSTSTPLVASLIAPTSSKKKRPKCQFTRLSSVEVKEWGHGMAAMGLTAQEQPKVVEVEGGLPGETVMAWVKKSHSYVDSVVTPSPDRVEPFCPHASECSGCSMQFLSDEGQARDKQEYLLKQFKNHSLSVDNVLPPILGPTKGYRAKARFSVRQDIFKNVMCVGFRSKNKKYVVEVRECPALDPRIGSKQFMDELYIMVNALSIKDQVPQIEIVVDDSGRRGLVLRHLKPLTPADFRRIAHLAKTTETTVLTQSEGPSTIQPLPPSILDSIYHNNNKTDNQTASSSSSSSSSFSPASPHFEWHVKLQPSQPQQQTSAQQTSEQAQPQQPPARTFTFHADITSFAQINREINDKMVSAVVSELDLKDDDVVLDLFCGLGNFTVPIAAQSASQGRRTDLTGLTVLGVDNAAVMIDQARRNAVQLNHVRNALFADADLHSEPGVQATYRGLLEVLKVRKEQLSSNSNPSQQQPQRGTGQQEVKVVIDPPRSGGGDVLMSPSSILFGSDHPDFIVRKIVYVSCGPASLARDAEVLVNAFGFRIASTRLVNMFPHTSASESITVFER